MRLAGERRDARITLFASMECGSKTTPKSDPPIVVVSFSAVYPFGADLGGWSTTPQFSRSAPNERYKNAHRRLRVEKNGRGCHEWPIAPGTSYPHLWRFAEVRVAPGRAVQDTRARRDDRSFIRPKTSPRQTDQVLVESASSAFVANASLDRRIAAGALAQRRHTTRFSCHDTVTVGHFAFIARSTDTPQTWVSVERKRS